MFDVYTGIYNDLCNTIFYLRTLQAPHSAPVCGTTCGMHVSAGFDKIFGHFRPEIRYGTLPRGSRDLYEMLPMYSYSIWHKLSTHHIGRTVPLPNHPRAHTVILRRLTKRKKFPPPLATRQARSYRANWATQTLLFSKALWSWSGVSQK